MYSGAFAIVAFSLNARNMSLQRLLFSLCAAGLLPRVPTVISCGKTDLHKFFNRISRMPGIKQPIANLDASRRELAIREFVRWIFRVKFGRRLSFYKDIS
ncbi:hypothetical protein C2L64_01445 [Paraburkholderia hospita]|uniref:Uncharacterized protein n=1 Tax=Paraburkholderia hospita TaxID=169430 RepID=A0AAN1J501_9BURK|nr:hypothetical protein C2L64_01445 [Paraburkholderia hospita]